MLRLPALQSSGTEADFRDKLHFFVRRSVISHLSTLQTLGFVPLDPVICQFLMSQNVLGEFRI